MVWLLIVLYVKVQYEPAGFIFEIMIIHLEYTKKAS